MSVKSWVYNNIANFITVFVGVPLCFVLLWVILTHRELAWLIIVLSLGDRSSDILDGILARWLKIVSNFGKIADTVHDKLFEGIIFFFLLSDQQVDIALKAIIVPIGLVEICLLGIRVVGRLRDGVTLAANKHGKRKMVFISVATLFCVLDVELAKHLERDNIVAVFLLFLMFEASLILAVQSFWGQLKSYRSQMRQMYREKRRAQRRALSRVARM